MKLDLLLQELAVSLGEFEASSGFSPDWEAPITLDHVAICSLADFPDRSVLPDPSDDPAGCDDRGWVAPVADPPVASAIMCMPSDGPEDLTAEFALASVISDALFRGNDRHQLGEALSFQGSVVAAILATHAPPDSRVLSLRLGLGSCTAHIYFLCDGKGRRWLEGSE